MKLKRSIMRLTAAGLLAAATAQGALIPVTEDIASGTEVTWTADNEYLLQTVIYVQTNATLVIEPGTVVRGAADVTIGRRGVPELVSALWVSQGGKLYATGTVDRPIIFTAEADDLNGNLPPTQTSLWGGVVIMGNAVINSAKQAVGNVSTPKFDKYEGLEDDPETGLPYPEHRFGGDDDRDSSGALRYVSIRHAGRIFAPDAELNCLTMGGVGDGTVLEYVEVYAGSDDGFEWWGGTVGSKYLVAGFIEDDCFDTDQGYRGINQFWFGIKPPWTGTADSRGIESDGDLNQSTLGELPLNEWYAYNVTSIGRGKGETAGSLGVAWNTRDEDVPLVFNSVFTEWNQGLKLDADGLYHHTNATALASIRNNLWNVNDAANAEGDFIFDTVEFKNILADPLLGGVSYTNDGVLDPRPQAGSPVYQDVLPGAPMAVSYRGAFSGPSDNWADGWTALSQYGYLKPATPVALPTITVQPEPAVTATVGETVNLSVIATGDEPITYQWTKDGVDLDGAVSATLSLTEAQESDSGTYAVKVTNAAGTVTSNDSVVTIAAAPLPTLWEIVSTTPELSTLKLAVETAGLVGALEEEDALTAFAPNNAAFDALPAGALDALLGDVEQLTAVLTYHVLAGTQLAVDLVAGDYVTLNGASVTVTTPEGMVMVNDATVILADVLASNGVAHVIDRVLIPSAPEPPTIQPPVIEDGQVTLSWTGEGEVETAAEINGPWTPTGNSTGSFSEEVGEGNKYFRIRRDQ